MQSISPDKPDQSASAEGSTTILASLLRSESHAPQHNAPDEIAGALHRVAVDVVELGGGAQRIENARAVLIEVVAAWSEDRRPDAMAVDREAAWIVRQSNQAKRPKGDEVPRLVLRTHADRRREREQPPAMIIDRALPAGGIGAIVAMPGAGKTLVGIEVSRCIAAGAPFLGRSTMAGRVVYACPDSPASTERRMLAILDEVAARIDTVAELPALPGGIADLRQAIEAVNEAGDPVRLLVIDTWDSARTHSSEGYAGQDSLIEASMRELRRLAADLALAVLVIHHATRADNGRARGSVVFDARADWIAVADGDGTTINLRSIKCRDGERGDLGTFQIVAVPVAGVPVPVLAPFGPGAAATHHVPPDDREGAVLAVLARHQGVISKRVLAERSGVPEGSVLRTVAALRAKRLVEADKLMATAAGFRAYEDELLGVDQTLDHATP